MAPHTNPLMAVPRQQPTYRNIDDYAETLNAMAWVRNSGFLYFVAERTAPNGMVTRYLERNDRAA